MRSTAAPSESAAAATMQMDLAFAEPAVERAFRAHMAACNRHTALLSEIARLIAWAIIALRLATAGDRLRALLASAGAASSIALVAWRANRCAVPSVAGIGEGMPTGTCSLVPALPCRWYELTASAGPQGVGDK